MSHKDDSKFDDFLLKIIASPPQTPADEWVKIHQELFQDEKMKSPYLLRRLKIAWPSLLTLALCFFVVFFNLNLYQEDPLDELLETSLSLDYSWEESSALPTWSERQSSQSPAESS